MDATSRCQNSEITFLPSATHFRDLTMEVAAAGLIDPVSNMSGDKVWIFRGGADDVVLWFWRYYCASGSGDYLGSLGSASTTLQETHPGYMDVVSSCP